MVKWDTLSRPKVQLKLSTNTSLGLSKLILCKYWLRVKFSLKTLMSLDSLFLVWVVEEVPLHQVVGLLMSLVSHSLALLPTLLTMLKKKRRRPRKRPTLWRRLKKKQLRLKKRPKKEKLKPRKRKKRRLKRPSKFKRLLRKPKDKRKPPKLLSNKLLRGRSRPSKKKFGQLQRRPRPNLMTKNLTN